MVYTTNILPYFDYADILCIGSYQLTLMKLQKQQNCALRICLRLGSRAKINVLHKMVEIELLSDRHNRHLFPTLCINGKNHNNTLLMLEARRDFLMP